MNDVEFIKRKNAIVFSVTGEVLVPESQIENVGNTKKMNGPLASLREIPDTTMLHAGICPYCKVFNDCDGCPMYEAENWCNGSTPNTWKIANKKWMELSTKSDQTKLLNLINEYNAVRQ